ncbi:MAG: sigma-70 family RNA polymerase sigma factor [Anaerolineaceae bacterium]|nr:sigma-70 family RNA polymerase sigma factor [Anaerolineaceae bacterium]
MSFRSEEERADQKKRAAFEDLFLQNWDKVYGVLFRLTGDSAEAEDLALETFVRLWQRPPSQDQTLAGWLYRVATNLGYNALRSAGRRSRHELDAGVEAQTTGSGSDNPANPAKEAERSEDRQRVQQTLQQMQARQAQLLILRHSGLSYQEIAETLNIAPASVGTLLVRAEKEFVQLYEKGEDHAHNG